LLAAMTLFGVLDLEIPVTLSSSRWFERLAYRYFAAKRREILNEETPGTLAGYLRRIEEVEGHDSYLRSREAVEICNEAILQKAVEQGYAADFSGDYDEVIEPISYPRLSYRCLEALGNEKLLRLRRREDRFRGWQIRRAAKALESIGDRATSLNYLLDTDAGAAWMERLCQNDPELAEAAFEIAASAERR